MQSRNMLVALGLLTFGGGAVAQATQPGGPAASPKPAPASKAQPQREQPKREAKAEIVASIPGDKMISLDFVAADINDVLKALALQAGTNIVTAADVKGNVTVSLNRVTVVDALDMVARLSGYQYAKVGATYVVGTQKSVDDLAGRVPIVAEKPAEPITEMIAYRYVRTGDLAKALESRFPGMRASLGGDDKGDSGATTQHTLVITDSPERVALARIFVAQLDTSAKFPMEGAVVDVYKVKYTSPTDLATIITRLVPTVLVTPGPTQGFQSGSSGASASYASSGQSGSGGAGAAGAAGAGGNGGSGTTNPSGAVASGSAPTTLLLTGAPADIARARAVLESIDTRAPQMSFEARVMDIGSTDLAKIGLSYDFGRPVSIGEANTTSAGTAPTVGALFNDPAKKLGFGSILRSPYSIIATLDLLAQDNRSRLLAKPNLSALDGQPAVVFIGDQIKYIIRQEVTTTGTNIQTETATVGITLKVTGKASPDGTVTLYVHPEVSVVSGYLTPGNGISLPQIASRYVDTTIRVKDGETIAIGGLIRENDITNIQKIPFLGDLPFFGQLFKHTQKSKDRSEIVIFITSRILPN